MGVGWAEKDTLAEPVLRGEALVLPVPSSLAPPPLLAVMAAEALPGAVAAGEVVRVRVERGVAQAAGVEEGVWDSRRDWDARAEGEREALAVGVRVELGEAVAVALAVRQRVDVAEDVEEGVRAPVWVGREVCVEEGVSVALSPVPLAEAVELSVALPPVTLPLALPLALRVPCALAVAVALTVSHAVAVLHTVTEVLVEREGESVDCAVPLAVPLGVRVALAVAEAQRLPPPPPPPPPPHAGVEVMLGEVLMVGVALEEVECVCVVEADGVKVGEALGEGVALALRLERAVALPLGVKGPPTPPTSRAT